MTWEAGEPCICYRIGFHVAAGSVQELLLVLVLNRIFRNLSFSQQSGSLLSYFDSICFILVFVVQVYSFKNAFDNAFRLLLGMFYCLLMPILL